MFLFKLLSMSYMSKSAVMHLFVWTELLFLVIIVSRKFRITKTNNVTTLIVDFGGGYPCFFYHMYLIIIIIYLNKRKCVAFAWSLGFGTGLIQGKNGSIS